MRVHAMLGLLIFAALAGCAEEMPEDESTQEAPEQPPADIGAEQVPVESFEPDAPPTWFTGHSNGTDLTALPFHIPDEAVVTYSPIPSFSFDAVILEVSVLTDEPLDAWGVYAFDVNGSKAQIAGALVSSSGHGSYYNLAPVGSDLTFEAATRPGLLYMNDDVAGRDVALVLATSGAQGPVSLSWRVMDVYPSFEDRYDVPDDHEAFVAAREGPAGLVTSIGNGMGYTVAGHSEIYVTSPIVVVHP